MATDDLLFKSYLRDNERYSDLINVMLFNGERRVQPDSLMDVNTEEINELIKRKDVYYYKVHRDLLKRGIYKSNGREVYCLFGIENQSHVDLRMPLRVMEYDLLTYKEQLKKKYKQTSKYKDSVEFLSKMIRTTKLTPVITLVFNLSNEEWNGPTSLHEMMDVEAGEEILRYIPNYPLNLISPLNMDDETIEKFTTSIKYVIQCSKYSNDANELYRITNENEAYKHLDIETAKVINRQMKLNLNIDEDKEVINMCKAVEDMKATSRNEGLIEGINLGRTEGIQMGRTEGGEDARLSDIRNLMANLSLSSVDAMKALGIPENQWEKYLSKLENKIS